MFSFSTFRAGVFFAALVSLMLFGIQAAPSAPAAQLDVQVPDVLKQWVPWVLYDQEDKTCTQETNGTGRRYCTWPTRLELEVNDSGAVFEQEWIVETRSLVALPGNRPYWPEKVRANGTDSVVIMKNGHPGLWLDPGRYLLTGSFVWPELPEFLFIPKGTGIVNLDLLGKKVKNVQLDEQGKLWFKHKNKQVQEREESLTVQVFRKINDGVPLTQQVRIILTVSGSPRQVTLGLALNKEFVPLSLNSPLPVRLDAQGRMQVQVRPGQWQIQLTLRALNSRSPEKIDQGSIAGLWPDQEIWVFKGDPRIRQVDITGLVPVDPSRTSLPGNWKNLPAYLIKSGQQMLLHEKYRGNPDPALNRLQISRTIWLDEDGKGLTTRDTITGTMSRGWRLNVDSTTQLGKVEVNGNSRLITRMPGSEKTGVEVRQGNLSLQAESRIKHQVHAGSLTIQTLGWDHTFERVSAVLNLPPGWKLLTASGIDKVSTWLNGWTLLDIFLVLIISLSTSRILGVGWGGVALCCLLLTFHQPGSPRYLWLPLLGLLALQQMMPAKKGELFFRICCFMLLLVIIITAVPFMVNEVRVGIYPQLEFGRYNSAVPVSNQGGQPMQEQVAADTISADTSSRLLSKSVQKMTARGAYSTMPAPSKSPRRMQIDPRAMIQTGPGLPDWNWQQIYLSWNGPVQPEQQIRLYLLSPLVNTVLAFVRVFLLVALILGFLRQCLPGNRKKTTAPPAVILSLFFFAVLVSPLLLFSSSASAEIPSVELLQELQDRLLAPPECGDNCAGISSCLIQLDNDLLKVQLQVDSLISGAVPLPGKDRFFDQIALDDQPAEIIRLNSQGYSLVRLEPGKHQVLLTKNVKGHNKLSFSFPLQPGRGQALVENWSISGLRTNGTLDKQVSLNRTIPAAVEENTAGDNRVRIPAFVQVERTLHMGLKWSLDTRVIRRSPDTAIALDIPLLPGERVLTDGLNLKGNAVRVNMEPEQPFFSWSSAMTPVDLLHFSAPETSSWTEKWFLDVSPIWHVETSGIPATSKTNPAGKRFPEYDPFPGESLDLVISRPDGVPGPVMTIIKSQMMIKPGQRATGVSLRFTLFASRGLKHAITLPANIDMQKSLINHKVYPLQLENNTLVFPIQPGQQEIEISWRSPHGVIWKEVSPLVNLGVESVNTTIEMQVPSNRWILLAGGPSIGPAVLFWGELLVIVVLALLLGRISFTPLSTVQWLLLSLGLSQIPVPFAALVVVWLLLLGVRKLKGGEVKAASTFNFVQVLLVLLTIAALGALFGAIQQGLLGQPDMQIGGNGSSGHLLRWYQDRSGSLLPTAWVITVPLLVYRLGMLLWALWLAVSLLQWLRWGWGCFSDTGIWRKTQSDSTQKRSGKTLFSRHRGEQHNTQTDEESGSVADEDVEKV